MRRGTGLLVLLGLMAGCALAADWPSFRGDSRQTGKASSPLPDKLEVLWKFQAKDSIESTAAIVGDSVYVGCMDGQLYTFDLATGKDKWKYKAAGPIKASPAVKDGKVYVGDLEGIFHCVDVANGHKVWTAKTESEIHSSANFERDRVVFGGSDGNLYCLDGKKGDVLWKFKTEGPIESSPVIADGRAFVTGCDPNVRVVRIADGKELPAIELDIQGPGSAAVSDDSLYVGNANKNSVIAVNWKKGEQVWEYRDPERGLAFHSSPAVSGQTVVIGGHDRFIHAIDAGKGHELWKFQTRGRVDSSPVIVGNRVVVGSNDGNLYALDLQKGTKLWEQALGSAVIASPAVGQNRLVIGTRDGILYCFGTK